MHIIAAMSNDIQEGACTKKEVWQRRGQGGLRAIARGIRVFQRDGTAGAWVSVDKKKRLVILSVSRPDTESSERRKRWWQTGFARKRFVTVRFQIAGRGRPGPKAKKVEGI